MRMRLTLYEQHKCVCFVHTAYIGACLCLWLYIFACACVLYLCSMHVYHKPSVWENCNPRMGDRTNVFHLFIGCATSLFERCEHVNIAALRAKEKQTPDTTEKKWRECKLFRHRYTGSVVVLLVGLQVGAANKFSPFASFLHRSDIILLYYVWCCKRKISEKVS